MPRRLCLDCRKRIYDRSRCTSCEKKRQRKRLKAAPWLALYAMSEWTDTKWSVHKRDGYRCTYADKNGRRCTTTNQTGRIEAHHTTKITELWKRAKGDMEVFTALALDRSKIITLCTRHHTLADRPKPGVRTQASVSADRLARRATKARRRKKVR